MFRFNPYQTIRQLTPARADRWFVFLLIAVTVLQSIVVATARVSLSPDEAYYWLWSKRLDTAYYSKGPAIAHLIAFGTSIFGDTAFGVRFPAILCSTLFSIFFYLLVRALTSSPIALLAWVCIRTALIFHSSAFAITTDPPLSVCWTIALAFGALAITRDNPRYWIGAHLAIAVGILSKYTAAILYVSIILLLLVQPRIRHHLHSFGFWLGTLLLGVVLLPIVFWNADHSWVNLAHNQSHVVSQSSFALKPRYFFELLGGQMGLVGPIAFLVSVYVLVRGLLKIRHQAPLPALFILSSAPLLFVCTVLSFRRSVYANWPMPIYIGAFVLLSLYVANDRFLKERVQKLVNWTLGINVLVLVVAHLLIFGMTFGLPAKTLPTKKIVGWESVGAKVQQVIDSETFAGHPPAALIGDSYGAISAIAFYTSSHPPVLCANTDDRRMNQFDLWGGWNELRGKSVLIAIQDPEVPEILALHFSRVEPLEGGTSFAVNYAGEVIRDFYFFRGTSYDGYAPPWPSKR